MRFLVLLSLFLSAVSSSAQQQEDRSPFTKALNAMGGGAVWEQQGELQYSIRSTDPSKKSKNYVWSVQWSERGFTFLRDGKPLDSTIREEDPSRSNSLVLLARTNPAAALASALRSPSCRFYVSSQPVGGIPAIQRCEDRSNPIGFFEFKWHFSPQGLPLSVDMPVKASSGANLVEHVEYISFMTIRGIALPSEIHVSGVGFLPMTLLISSAEFQNGN